MPTLIHHHDRFDPLKYRTYTSDAKATVRELLEHDDLIGSTSLVAIEGRELRTFSHATLCLLNGRPIPHSKWDMVAIEDADVISFAALHPQPAGGQGGSNPLSIVLMVATVVAAAYLGPELIPVGFAGLSASGAAALGSAAITLAGGALSYGLMSLFAAPPPPTSSAGYANTSSASPTYSLQAQGNYGRLGQPIPELFGRQQVYPDFVAASYARYVDDGTVQWGQEIHSLYGISMGEVVLEKIQIGDRPILFYAGAITYEVRAPGQAGDTTITDARWLTCKDLAEPDLQPWNPLVFAVNPSGTSIADVEFDFVAPQGLYDLTAGSGSILGMRVDLTIEVRRIDDDANPLADWIVLDGLNITETSQQPVRRTYTYHLPQPGRWQVRMTRISTIDETPGKAHHLSWTGLRGLQNIAPRTFDGMTVIAVKMRATAGLSGASSQQLNVIATRKLPTWDFSAGQMGTALVATRNPCDAFAHIARSQNGARLADSRIDLAGLYQNYNDFDAKGWFFDFVFDQAVSCSEALRRVAASVIAQHVVQGNKLRLVRDVPAAAAVAMFGPRNTIKGSLQIEYKMSTSTTADAVRATFVDPKTWKPSDPVTVSMVESPQRITDIDVYGVTNRAQLTEILTNLDRANHYRRRTVRWQSEMEGLGLLYGDPVHFTTDIPSWGQSAEVLDWDEATSTLTVDEPLAWTPEATHYVQVRTDTGHAAGPFEATEVGDDPHQLVVGAGVGEIPPIRYRGDRERTFVQFGPGEAYARRLKVIAVTPRDDHTADITAIDDDPRMYEAVG